MNCDCENDTIYYRQTRSGKIIPFEPKYCPDCGTPLAAPEPLSIERLKRISQEMERRHPDGWEWIWIEILEAGRELYHKAWIESGYYRSILDYTDGMGFCCGYPGLIHCFYCKDYGVTWLPYQHQPPTLTNHSGRNEE